MLASQEGTGHGDEARISKLGTPEWERL